MGKTTLLFHALNQLREKARTVFLFQTICTPMDFLRALLAGLGVHETQGSLIELQSKLNEVLAEQSRSGKPLVVVIDEAQNLDDSVLELVRMLSNFETRGRSLYRSFSPDSRSWPKSSPRRSLCSCGSESRLSLA